MIYLRESCDFIFNMSEQFLCTYYNRLEAMLH